ncbi:hypothetical protein OMW55_10630 [Sphingomonas sp. BN140010]|uniref:HdeD family acid-resistance protein n=1 Tax=Sphingomonas arvum TaxID=2992113 RepID=A0ABT3JGZ1_9SPHN|nr:hypothetical protein [Sphingomonas sp. BN140010]MCW3798256.1 hypothetical protein [Sphingomonas sp. BN140010]
MRYTPVMAAVPDSQPNDRRAVDNRRGIVTLITGWLILAIAAMTFILPLGDPRHAGTMLGLLLVAAGGLEIVAGSQRNAARLPSMAAGVLTAVVGVLFLTGEWRGYIPAVNVVLIWLVLHSMLLLLATLRGGTSSVRKWTGIAAATDFLLGALLLIGVSISSLVYNLFGPTEYLVASFAWILALSFVATGTMLLEVANCEREGAA